MYIIFIYVYIYMGNNFDIGMPIKFSIISQRLFLMCNLIAYTCMNMCIRAYFHIGIPQYTAVSH